LESSELLQTTVRRIVIFGSGRWAKVYIKAVVEMVHDEVEIVCCSSYGYQSLLSWARENGLNERISVQKQISNALSGERTVAIVCNAAQSHYLTVRNIISWNVPVLVEKPFCMYASQLSELMDISQKKRL
jgi:predicted dehydrogenase